MSINQEAVAVWDTIAPEWDAGMGRDGNIYWNVLEKPALERLLHEKRASDAMPVRALDISTGNGLTARWLVSFLGGDGDTDSNNIEVTATDGSEEMLERARRWSSPEADATPAQRRIRFAKLDVTQPADFDSVLLLSRGLPFDAILMNMAIMDVPTLEPLAAALPKLLPIGGVFVGSLLHPVFFTPRARRIVEVVNDYDDAEDGGKTSATATTLNRAYRLDRYLHVPPWRGFAVPGQARAQYYFHRPLHELFGVFLKTGQLAIDGIEEPAFAPEHATQGPPTSSHSTRHFTEFPPIFVFRLRRIK
ncbi:methyltransferase type 11 [Ophiostoma piceae UAMH 11346]|uniref:Methyltransferase type 11 n=1 Tax=Ophiostoma piceae (strain UAMH 11346) TaxID=1262450 RepID=S3D4Q5_OPHP1|nr:methyltransferase type 11 [Ophiostoma piceae UAMH 11346]